MLSPRYSERAPSSTLREHDVFEYMEAHPSAFPPLLDLNDAELQEVYSHQAFEAVTNRLLRERVGDDRGGVIESFLGAIATVLEVLEDQAETRVGHTAEELEAMTESLNKLTDHLLRHSQNIA